jgi:hypothetical protein
MNRPLIHKNRHNEFQNIDVTLNAERATYCVASTPRKKDQSSNPTHEGIDIKYTNDEKVTL